MELNLAKLINPSQKQLKFLEAVANYDYVLYGGAAGGGKSYILRWWLVLYLIALYQQLGIRNAHVGLFCEDYPSLNDRQISKIQAEFPKELGELKLGGESRGFHLRPELGSGVIALRNLDDPAKYLSAEFAAIAVDELTRNKKEMFDFLRMRLRWPGVTRPKFAGGSNPGGEGHDWVKELWVKKEFPIKKYPELRTVANQFKFVQARAADNPHLSSSYYEKLGTLPPDMAKIYAEGSWDVFMGQFFNIFNKNEHVTSHPIGADWFPRWISIDWGYEDPSAVLWHWSDEQGVATTYREAVQNHLTPIQLAELIVERSRGEKILNVYLSPDAWAKRTDEKTIASQMTEVLVRNGIPEPERAANDRAGGWMLMYDMMRTGKWLISDACPNLIENIPQLTRDMPDKPEDCLEFAGDHSPDSARYGLYTRFGHASVPMGVQVDRKIEAANITDPTSVMIWRKKFERQELNRVAPVHFSRRRFGR